MDQPDAQEPVTRVEPGVQGETAIIHSYTTSYYKVEDNYIEGLCQTLEKGYLQALFE